MTALAAPAPIVRHREMIASMGATVTIDTGIDTQRVGTLTGLSRWGAVEVAWLDGTRTMVKDQRVKLITENNSDALNDRLDG